MVKDPPLFRSLTAAALLFAGTFALCVAMAVGAPGLVASGTDHVSTSENTPIAFPTPPPIGFTVNSTTDSGDSIINGVCETSPGNGQCTLRAAIQEANAHPGTSITFNIPASQPNCNAATGSCTIALNNALPALSAAVTISGPGPDKLTIRRSTTGNYSVFTVTTTGTVTLSGMTISNGNVGGINNQSSGTVNISNSTIIGNSNGAGGGIYNGGTVTVKNSTLSSNRASSGGGGIFNNGVSVSVINSTLIGNSTVNSSGGVGGGIFNNNSNATVNVINSTLEGNTAQERGGGIYNAGTLKISNSTLFDNSVTSGSGGAGIYNQGTVTITDSTINDNSARSGSPFPSQGGGVYNMGSVSITNSALSGNSAGKGGGIFNQTQLTVTNSTLYGNTADALGGNGGGIDNEGTAIVTNSTLSGNGASSGGGIFNSFGQLVMKSCLVASNSANSSGPDVSGMFASGGFNLIGKTDGSTGFTATTDLTGTIAAPLDPKFDPNGLRDNGGPTDTIALLTGSPAIDKGTSKGLTGTLTTDQRGVGYSRIINKSVPNATGGDGTDIGAFEVGAQIKAVSRKTHGTVGNFDIKLPLFGPKAGVECRKGGTAHVFKLILTFPKAVTLASVSAAPDPAAPGATGSVSSFSVSGSIVTLNLTGVSNAQTIFVNLFGVSDGAKTNDVSVPMGVLFGDTGGNGSVANADVTLTQSKVGQPVGVTNFREDVDINGAINSTDVQLVTSKKGTVLP